jgi:hypothetical protein
MSLALSSFFNIRPGEGKKAAIMFLYSLFMVSGVFVLGRSIGRALFLSALPKEAIAYRFILPPLGVMLVAAGYTRLVRRYTVKQLILGSTGLLIAGLLGFRLLLETPYGHHEIKSLLLPLIESPAAQVCHLAHQRFGVACLPRVERLGYLAGYPDSWLRSCAIFEIGQLGLTELTGSILTALIADEELVRETAQVANQQLGPMRAV